MINSSRLLFLVLLQYHRVCSYPNVTLRSGDLAVVIYLPSSLSNNEDRQAFYEGSRFEHGSMIGSITRKSSDKSHHYFYGADLWRYPHDPKWPESGIGLASEFGVGDNGDFCYYRCGWNGASNVTNGVLGYDQARVGESFLKIGVGELIKGSCPACDSTGGYMFNSPYKFASMPMWTMHQPSVGTIVLDHEAHLKNYGYRITKNIRLEEDGILYVTTSLTNLGTEALSTVWYSHHFFSCDSQHIGPGYEVEMDFGKNSNPYGPAIQEGGISGLYEEPGVLAMWAKKLRMYANVNRGDSSVKISMNRAVEPGTRIKAEFMKDESSSGSFGLNACGTWIGEDIPELKTENDGDNKVSMYGFNLYIEKDTLSPEPQLLIDLKPSHSKSWTQRLIFKDVDSQFPSSPLTELMQSQGASILGYRNGGGRKIHAIPGFFIAAGIVSVAILAVLARQPQRYAPIPDAELTV